MHSLLWVCPPPLSHALPLRTIADLCLARTFLCRNAFSPLSPALFPAKYRPQLFLPAACLKTAFLSWLPIPSPGFSDVTCSWRGSMQTLPFGGASLWLQICTTIRCISWWCAATQSDDWMRAIQSRNAPNHPRGLHHEERLPERRVDGNRGRQNVLLCSETAEHTLFACASNLSFALGGCSTASLPFP